MPDIKPGRTYRVRTAVVPEEVKESVVQGVVAVGVDAGVLFLRSQTNDMSLGSQKDVLAVYSNGSWVDAVLEEEGK